MSKAELAQAIKKAGSAEKFAESNIKAFAKKIINTYGVDDATATGLAKGMVMELMAEITYGDK